MSPLPLALFTGGIGIPELLIVAGVFLLLFGSTRLPSLMRNMGRSINEFKAGLQDKPDMAGSKGIEHADGEADKAS